MLQVAVAPGGLDLELLKVGGGFPAQYRTPIPPIAADYAAAIDGGLNRYFGGAVPRLLVWLGRYLVGDAGEADGHAVRDCWRTRSATSCWSGRT
ncbi:MAG TPA: hypothetical protein VN823_01230 [Stellaceae bacterium]|nr:hypothetical protein [Stellaceae bacterium]